MLKKIKESIKKIAELLSEGKAEDAVSALEKISDDIDEGEGEGSGEGGGEGEGNGEGEGTDGDGDGEGKGTDGEEIKKIKQVLKKYADMYVSASSFAELMKDFTAASKKIEALEKTAIDQSEQIKKLEGEEDGSTQPDGDGEGEDIKKTGQGWGSALLGK